MNTSVPVYENASWRKWQGWHRRWFTEDRTSRAKADFDEASANCDGGFGAEMVKRWLDHLEAGGEYGSFHDF